MIHNSRIYTCLLAYCKGYNSRRAERKRSVGQGVGGVFPCFSALSRCRPSSLDVFTDPEALWLSVFRGFYRISSPAPCPHLGVWWVRLKVPSGRLVLLLASPILRLSRDPTLEIHLPKFRSGQKGLGMNNKRHSCPFWVLGALCWEPGAKTKCSFVLSHRHHKVSTPD